MNRHSIPKKIRSEQLITIAQKAAIVTRDYFSKPFEITHKTNNEGIVTTADLKSEQLICAEIRKINHDAAIYAEESSEIYIPFTKPRLLWIIDPIDGTTNFSKGNFYHCISIACGWQTEPHTVSILAGCVLQPMTNMLFYADQNEGAFCNGNRIKVSDCAAENQLSIATGFAGAKDEPLRKVTNCIFDFQQKILGMRVNGAAALDLSYTAQGTLDGFFESGLKPWDIAAGALLVSEAGGRVTNYKNEPINILKDNQIIAASPNIHKIMLPIIQKNY